ncbi:helicase-exonuclease AddAB subunit AddB [Ornithinibacillus sp. 4-3]|uniref:ATP-dependent helicase/deoxyribonuclease subunit B n=1 Tax=Ornithinibacillus sp. 4-3 TaxID=3231488 RepID=A0AB39HT23_9BACI
MGLRFVLGRAGAGQSNYLLREVREKLQHEARGPAIFYIVPDQMTFQQEYKLYQENHVQGSMRAQVVSFSRLAWHILQETGGATRPFISSVGIQMMLRKIIEEKQGDFQVFQKALEKQGFLDDLENMITEFKRYRISPDTLLNQMDRMNEFVHKESSEQSLLYKLDDLYYIYQQLVSQLQGKYLDGEDRLQLLAEKIELSKQLETAEIYLDGFHRFTPQELLVVETLLKKCKRVTIGLTVDQVDENMSELDLFYQTNETYCALRSLTEQYQIPIEEVIRLRPEDARFKERPAMQHLENHFDTRPSPAFLGKAPIQMAEAIHPRAEVEGVAQEIIRLVREENYRFKDMAIFIRQTDMYHELLSTIFEDYGIPLFIDEKKTMLHHPLIELLRSALEIVEGNWRYDTVFRVIKTGFIRADDEEYPLTNDAIDELENYVIEHGIRSRETWFSDQPWIYRRFSGFSQRAQTDEELEMQRKINAYRRQVVQGLQTFDEQIRQAKTIRELCETTFRWLEHIDVPSRLEEIREAYDASAENELAREQEQVWDAIIQLFDEMVEMAGEEVLSLSSFRSILDAGLKSLKFSHVPPSIDHVIVGTIDRSRISGIRAAFLLGVNEGVWPNKPPSDVIISEQERTLLAYHGLQLAENSQRKLLDEWFYIYLAFTAARDFLWISYPISDGEGKAKIPSQLIKRIAELFPMLNSPILLGDPEEIEDAERFITTSTTTRSVLTAKLAKYKRGYPMKEIWDHVLNWYISNEPKYGTTYQVLQSIFYENRPKNLSKQTVGNLYDKQIKTSVSRLEMYYRCSYQHFAQYNLQLQERRKYTLEAPDIGSLFHEALKMITEWVQREGNDFANLSRQDAKAYAQRALNDLAPILQNQILSSSNRYQYIKNKLFHVIARATYILSEQARKSGFSPVSVELSFGENGKLNPLVITLPNGYELLFRGRIDRVDKAMVGSDLYLRIIDYKSSETGLNLVHVYYGIALQMLAYLDIILAQSESWLGMKASPAGVLYFHVHNAMLRDFEQMDEQKIEEELFKQYKMKGLLISEADVVKEMDTTLDKGYSQIVPAAINAKGGFYSNASVANEQTFDGLRAHIHDLIIQAGIDITSGRIDLAPYEYKERNACTFCQFKSVCQFDPSLTENKFRTLKDKKDEEIIHEILQNKTLDLE